MKWMRMIDEDEIFYSSIKTTLLPTLFRSPESFQEGVTDTQITYVLREGLPLVTRENR